MRYRALQHNTLCGCGVNLKGWNLAYENENIFNKSAKYPIFKIGAAFFIPRCYIFVFMAQAIDYSVMYFINGIIHEQQ